MPNQSISTIESLESFCARVSQKLASDGFAVNIQPGDHLVDDAGVDSLTVLTYVSALQEMGITVDLTEFDTTLLNIDDAYKAWLQIVASNTYGEM